MKINRRNMLKSVFVGTLGLLVLPKIFSTKEDITLTGDQTLHNQCISGDVLIKGKHNVIDGCDVAGKITLDKSSYLGYNVITSNIVKGGLWYGPGYWQGT